MHEDGHRRVKNWLEVKKEKQREQDGKVMLMLIFILYYGRIARFVISVFMVLNCFYTSFIPPCFLTLRT